MSKPLVCEIAWAAGFFDGEGYTRAAFGERAQLGVLAMSVAQKDLRPLNRFMDAVGAGAIHGPHPNRKSPVSYWMLSGGKAEAVLRLLWPFLSEPKRDQAIGAIRQLRAKATERLTYESAYMGNSATANAQAAAARLLERTADLVEAA